MRCCAQLLHEPSRVASEHALLWQQASRDVSLKCADTDTKEGRRRVPINKPWLQTDDFDS